MNKNTFLTFSFLAAIIGGFLYFTNILQSPLLHLTHNIKASYSNFVQSIHNSIDEHIHQQQTIVNLQKKINYYEKELLELHQVAYEYKNIIREQNSTIKTLPEISIARTISYVRFGDTNKLWIEMENFDPKKVYGLLYRGYTAGIVLANQGQPMALLNTDPKCSYAVSIGSSMAPGIVRGNNARQMIVEFIPSWIPISIGDEVLTSGLDKIFLSGLKVGKVISIHKAQGYQNAIIEPYFYGKNPTYFHIIGKNR